MTSNPADVTQADRNAADDWVNARHGHDIAEAFARHRIAALQQSRSVVIQECAKALDDDATKCDCAAFTASECNCGSWEDYKRITSARAAEIIRVLAD